MNFKQKAVREKQAVNHRYQTEAVQNCDSSPNLIRLKDLQNYNKENKNHINQHANQEQIKSQRFDPAKSSQFKKRMKTAACEIQTLHFRDKKTNENQLHSSQQFFRFRTKPNIQRQENGFISQQLTFGETNHRKGMFTSRQFLEEKKMKNQMIDQIIMNSQRGLCKSFNDFSINGFYCVNHRDKKAKYRLMSELTEGEVEMFYCSKCAINLLQQHFKISQIKPDQCYGINNFRIGLISKLQSKLKCLQNETQLQINESNQQRELQIIQQEIMNTNNKFELMMRIIEKMRNKSIQKLHELYLKKQNQNKIRKENLSQIMLQLTNTQQQIKEYKGLRKFANMKQNQIQFITTSLNNKITKFSQNLENLKPKNAPLSLNCFDQNQILEHFGDQVMKRMQKQHTRRERQITFSRRSSIKQENQQSQDQFICDELKRPFRVLFPSDQIQQGNKNEIRQRSTMLQSVKQRPTFTQFQ